MKKNNSFNPLLFLAALGAGGISVIPFSFFQYTTPHPKGLVTFAQMGHGSLPLGKEILYYGLEGVMVVFALLHIVLSVMLLSKLSGMKNSEIAEILNVSLETVKIRLHRGRTRLKKELEKGCDFYVDEQRGLSCDRKPSKNQSSTPLKFNKFK